VTPPRIRSAVLHDCVVTVEWQEETRHVEFDLNWLAVQAGRSSTPVPGEGVRTWLEGEALDVRRCFAWRAAPVLREDVVIRATCGDSLFADGFALAERLRTTAPESFRCLTQQPVPFRYRSRDAELYAERPLIQLTHDGQVSAVHYNSRSIATLRLAASEVRPFYAAYRQFAALLREPRYQVRLQLAAGEMVVFDNQRILHGRTAYSSARHARHLRGCYLTRDSVRSQAAVLHRRADSRAGAVQ
jgi:hypothetical protein